MATTAAAAGRVVAKEEANRSSPISSIESQRQHIRSTARGKGHDWSTARVLAVQWQRIREFPSYKHDRHLDPKRLMLVAALVQSEALA